jgi:hypothetical protein
MKSSIVTDCVGIVSANGPGSEKTENEKEDFGETMSECLIGFEQSETIVR